MAPAGLQHPHLHRRVHLMRAPGGTVGPVHQARKALVLVPPEPPVHRLAGHVEPVGHIHHLDSIADDREHCLVPLLHDTQLQQHVRSVTDQAEPA
jgi:hypothetical protein